MSLGGALELAWDGWEADLRRANGDYTTGGGLETAVLVSVFSSARAPVELTADLAPEQRRGWWGEDPADPFGSLFWLTDRATRSQETLVRAREWVQTSLQWLVRLQIAERVTVTAEYDGEVLVLSATIVRGTARRWARAWDSLRAGTYNAGQTTLRLLTA